MIVYMYYGLLPEIKLSYLIYTYTLYRCKYIPTYINLVSISKHLYSNRKKCDANKKIKIPCLLLGINLTVLFRLFPIMHECHIDVDATCTTALIYPLMIRCYVV